MTTMDRPRFFQVLHQSIKTRRDRLAIFWLRIGYLRVMRLKCGARTDLRRQLPAIIFLVPCQFVDIVQKILRIFLRMICLRKCFQKTMIRTSEPFLVFLIFLVLRTVSFFLVVFESKIYLAGPAVTV